MANQKAQAAVAAVELALTEGRTLTLGEISADVDAALDALETVIADGSFVPAGPPPVLGATALTFAHALLLITQEFATADPTAEVRGADITLLGENLAYCDYWNGTIGSVFKIKIQADDYGAETSYALEEVVGDEVLVVDSRDYLRDN